MRAVGVATLNANSVKRQRINEKSEPSKCSGLAISRRRQIYAMIGVELRTSGEMLSNIEDSFAYVSYSSKDSRLSVPGVDHGATRRIRTVTALAQLETFS